MDVHRDLAGHDIGDLALGKYWRSCPRQNSRVKNAEFIPIAFHLCPG